MVNKQSGSTWRSSRCASADQRRVVGRTDRIQNTITPRIRWARARRNGGRGKPARRVHNRERPARQLHAESSAPGRRGAAGSRVQAIVITAAKTSPDSVHYGSGGRAALMVSDSSARLRRRNAHHRCPSRGTPGCNCERKRTFEARGLLGVYNCDSSRCQTDTDQIDHGKRR